MSCPRSTASMEPAAICWRASGCRWVAACPAREDAAAAPRPPFKPITRLWQFEVLIGMGSRRRSASQAIDLPSDGGGNLGRLFTMSALPSAADIYQGDGHVSFVQATSITDGSSVSGDRKLKEGTPRLARVRPQPSAVGFDDRPADR